MNQNTRLNAAIYLLYFVFAILLNSVGILIQKSINVYGVDELSASSLEGFKDLSIALVSFLIGSLLPKLGYKRGLLLGLGLVFLGCLGMYFGNAFWAVKLLFACTGVAFAVVKVAVYALISTLSESKSKLNSFLSSVESVFMVGIATAYIIFPFFYSDTDPDAWLRIYILLAIFIALAAAFISSIQFNSVEAQQQGSSEVSFWSQFSLLKQPIVLVFALCAFMYVMTEQGIMSWLPTFNEKVLHLPEKLSVNMAVILALSIALGRAISGQLVKRIHWLPLLLGCLGGALFMVIFILPKVADAAVGEINSFGDVPWVGYVFPLIGLFLAPIYPLMNAAVLGATEDKLFSQMAGILTFFSAVGGTLGSRIVGYLFQNMGGEKAFFFAIIPLSILVLALYMLHRFTSKAKLHASI